MLSALGLSAVILICGLSIAIGDALGRPPPPTETPTVVPLPVRSAAEVMTQLQRVGVTAQAVQTIPAPNPTWQASQALQFKIGPSVFLLLSYVDMDAASADASKATNSGAFKTWQVIQVANVILAALPGADAAMVSALTSHLTTYLVAPYRPSLPTATPAPSATPK
jgi:hypothetical protein